MCDVKPEQLSYERFPDIYVARSDVDTEIALPEKIPRCRSWNRIKPA
jgi:hypothetical protein